MTIPQMLYCILTPPQTHHESGTAIETEIRSYIDDRHRAESMVRNLRRAGWEAQLYIAEPEWSQILLVGEDPAVQ
jgi:hypothetical protein